MVITGTRRTGATLYPLYWFGNYAAYRNAGGIILAHTPTGRSCYFQPGDDAAAFERRADEVMSAPLRCDFDDSTAERQWGDLCASYDELMILPDEAGGRPSSDGGFWAFFA